MQIGGLFIYVLLKPELLSTLQRRNFFLKKIIWGALKSFFVKGYKMSFGSCERLHNVYTVWMAAEKEVRRLHWERVREGELLRGGVFFGNFWLSMTFCEKKDFELFLSIGVKSPVFPVACGVRHCFISCEGLATTRSGYPTVGGGEEQKSSF